jgi:exopolysaccharide biosynthesis protein
VVLITVDGRQPDFSLGIYQKQMADLMLEFGASDAMDLDSGGSATMVIEGRVVNHPSDGANPDGTGGKERPVANALLVFCGKPAPQGRSVM